MFEGLVTVLNLFYSLNEPYACVRFAGDNDPSLFFVLLHQSLMYRDADDVVATADIYEFFGSAASPKFEVEDRDCLVILAKRHDMIVASQVYEVNFGTAQEQGYLLLPRGGYNLLCDQHEMEQVDCERPTIPVGVQLPWYASMTPEERARLELGF